jgi:hypothetical protein
LKTARNTLADLKVLPKGRPNRKSTDKANAEGEGEGENPEGENIIKF